jgi:fibronectin type 3 domain-containing protein
MMKRTKNLMGIVLLITASVLGACVFPGGASHNGTEGAEGLSAPVGLTATALSHNTVYLSWEPVEGIELYTVFVSDHRTGGYEAVDEVDSTVFTDASLEPDTSYYYKVAATNADGQGPLSVYCLVHTQVYAPDYVPVLLPPTTVAAETLSLTSIRLSWSAVAGAKYNIYRSLSYGGEYAKLNSSLLSSASYIDTDLSPETTYYYAVYSVNANDEEGPRSSIREAATAKIDLHIPVPSGLNAVAVSSSEILVSWNMLADASKYNLYYAASAEGTYALLTPYGITGLSYRHTGLVLNETYRYKVSAMVSAREGPPSGAIQVELGLLPAPQGLSAALQSAASLRLVWDNVPGAASYKLYYAASAAGSYSLLQTVTTASYTHSGLSRDTEYYYKVSAINGIGEGAESAAVMGKIAVPSAPTGLSAATMSATSIQISWASVPSATGYKVYRSLTSGGAYTLAGTTASASWTNTGLSTGSIYYYKVASVNGIGEGEQSASVQGMISLPPAPTGLTVTPLSHTSLRISWDAVPGAALYSIYRYYTTGDYNILTSVTATSHVDSGLDPYKSYSYRIAAVNDIGTGTQAAAVSAYTQPIPLSDGVWYSRTNNASNFPYNYYSFPVTGGSYYIQWGNVGHTGETSAGVSAYWKSDNSMTDLSTSYFVGQNGLANPRQIAAPSSGYIIVRVSLPYPSTGYNYDIRFYRE